MGSDKGFDHFRYFTCSSHFPTLPADETLTHGNSDEGDMSSRLSGLMDVFLETANATTWSKCTS